jgi:O-antigen/teichoic acid export membrane protein
VFKSIIHLASGSAGVQVLYYASLPLVIGFHSVEDVGVYSVFMSVSLILSSVMALRYEVAISDHRLDSVAKILVSICLMNTLFLSVIIFPLLFLLWKFGFIYSGLNESLNILLLTLVNSMFLTAINTLVNYLGRCREYKKISLLRLGQAALISALMSIESVFWGSMEGLLYSVFLGNMVCMILGYLMTPIKLIEPERFQRYIAVAKRYKKYPKFSVLESILVTGSQNLVVPIFAYALSYQAAASFFLALKLVNAPVQIIVSSISQVYLSNGPAWYRENKLKGKTKLLVLNTIKYGWSLLFVYTLLVVFLADSLLPVGYHDLTMSFLFLVPWVAIKLISSPISWVLNFKGLLELALFMKIFLFIFRLLPLVVCVFLAPFFAVKVYAVSSFLMSVLFLMVYFYHLRTPAQKVMV